MCWNDTTNSHVGIERKGGRAKRLTSKREGKGCGVQQNSGHKFMWLCIYGYFLCLSLSVVWEHWHFGAREKRSFSGVCRLLLNLSPLLVAGCWLVCWQPF